MGSGAKPRWLCLPVLLLFSNGCLHQFYFLQKLAFKLSSFWHVVSFPMLSSCTSLLFPPVLHGFWLSWLFQIFLWRFLQIEPDPERLRCSQSHLVMQRRAKTRTWGRVLSLAGQKHSQPFWRFPGLLLYIKSRGDLGRIGEQGARRAVLCAGKNTQLTREYLNTYHVLNTELGQV